MQQTGPRLSILDPPIMTVVVYGGVILAWQLDHLGTPIGRMLLIPASLGLLIVPIVSARALGHALMSAVGGGRLLRLASGPFQLRRVDGRLKFGLNTRWAHYPGNVVTAPDPDADLRKWIRWRETGSFLGMLTYAAVVLLANAWLQNQPFIADFEERSRVAATLTFGLSVLIITLGVWQLINRHIPRIWRMTRGNQGADREAAIIAMTSMMLAGGRPSTWPPHWPELAAWDEDDSVEGLYGHRFAYLYALDTGDLESAERFYEYLEENTERLPSRLTEQLVDLERPFVEAWIRNNAEKAREEMDALGTRIVERYRLRRIQAAVMLAAGELQTAREYATEGLNAAGARLHDGEVHVDAGILKQILDQTGGDIGEMALQDDRNSRQPAPGESPEEVPTRQ